MKTLQAFSCSFLFNEVFAHFTVTATGEKCWMLFGECGNWISVGSIIYRSSLQWALDECHPSESALSPAINLCIFVEVACLSNVCVETKRKKIIKIKTIRNQKWHALKCVGRIFFHINYEQPEAFKSNSRIMTTTLACDSKLLKNAFSHILEDSHHIVFLDLLSEISDQHNWRTCSNKSN